MKARLVAAALMKKAELEQQRQRQDEEAGHRERGRAARRGDAR
eukprot:gene2294-20421_t